MTTIATLLEASASRFPTKTALVTNQRTLTYGELLALRNRFAGALQCAGVRPGDKVSIHAPNSWQWIVVYHAILAVGAVVNPLNSMLTVEETAFAMADCEASALVATSMMIDGLADTGSLTNLRAVIAIDESVAGAMTFDDFLAPADSFVAVAISEYDVCTIGYTSGTTGRPKGAVQTHRAVALNCALTARAHSKIASDVVLTALPAAHVYGNVCINGTFSVGGTVVLVERFDPFEALSLIERHCVTMFEGVPAMYAMLLASDDVSKADLSSLNRCTVGGQTMPVTTMHHWEALSGAPLIELWGMTELSGLGMTHPAGVDRVHGSIGVPLPGVEARVATIDDAATEVPTGTPGELCIRGPIVTNGYFGDEQATAEVITEDGWLRSGDVAYVDSSGLYWIVDRKKDLIITAGFNIYPAEIERVLAGHPAVALVAVGPVPDQLKGELARAYVVVHNGADTSEEELIAYCRASLAPYKIPRSVRFVEALPQTSTGKIQRRRLIEAYE